MGQYHKIVNLDKRQYLHPHAFGDGLKLVEFGSAGEGTMMALAVLLATDNGRGGGDLKSNHPLVGSWAGDRIVIAGDYGDRGEWLSEFPDAEGCNLYEYASQHFEDISQQVKEIIADAEGDWCRISQIGWPWEGESAQAYEIVRELLELQKKHGGTMLPAIPIQITDTVRLEIITVNGKMDVRVLVEAGRYTTDNNTLDEVREKVLNMIEALTVGG